MYTGWYPNQGSHARAAAGNRKGGVMVHLNFISDMATEVHHKSSQSFLGDLCLAEICAEAPGKHFSALSSDTKRNFLNYPP